MTTAMAAALQSAGIQASTPAPKSKNGNGKRRIDIPKKSRRNVAKGQWGKSGRPNMIEWSHPELGAIQIELKKFLLGSVIYQEGPNTWCRVNLGNDKPNEIVLDFLYSLNDDVELLHVRGTSVVDTATEEPEPFALAIEWKPGAKRDSNDVPNLVGGYMQDFRLIAMSKKSGFQVHLDVAVASRNGEFWVTVQEVTGAQIVWHSPDDNVEGLTSVTIGERAYTAVAVYNENCYPGFDPVASWNRSYEGCGDKVLAYAAKFGAAVSVDDCSPGQWEPQWPADIPVALANKGYQKAVVLWFNLTLGYGHLQLEDGQPCFVHFKAIQDETGKNVAQSGEFPVLENGKGCYVKWMLKPDKSGEMKPAATAVRAA